jgi:hypothetical protein
VAFGKTVLSFLLALLLAQPACCCSLPGFFGTEAESIPSCCGSQESSDSSPSSPCEDESCQCESQLADIVKVDLTLPFPGFLASFPPPRYAPDFSLAFPPREKLRADAIVRHPPPLKEFRILFQNFRL